MILFYASISLTILASVLYHVFIKLTPADANPFLTLVIIYVTAGLACLAIFQFYPSQEGWRDALRRLNWTAPALGLTIVGLEIGFLLAYRAGWRISMSALVANVCVALVLIPLGLAFFKDRLSPLNLLGILLCILGLVLINLR
jgi:drug/metabolite transporter (DMT)-like permease